jgi:hypothetical protein
MAAGDVYNKFEVFTTGGEFCNLQPAAGVEVVVHNISHVNQAELQYFNGTDFVVVDTQSGNGSWIGMFLHCTNTLYYRVKNTNSGPNSICCDGMTTK